MSDVVYVLSDYRPPAGTESKMRPDGLPTARGSVMSGDYVTQQSAQEAYNQRMQEKIVREKQEKDARSALEEERLRELAQAQPSVSGYHGTGSENYIAPISSTQRFEHSDQYGSATNTGYRPSENWDYEKDAPTISYYDYFGEPSLDDISEFDREYFELVDAGVWDSSELAQLNTYREDFLNGEISPHSATVQNSYVEFNAKERTERTAFFEDKGFSNYDMTASNLQEAKTLADSYYINYLKEQKNIAKTQKDKNIIQEYIDKGAPSFETVEELEFYQNLSEDDAIYQAALVQKEVMADFFERADGVSPTDSQDLYISGEKVAIPNSAYTTSVTMNTGTLLGAPNTVGTDVVELGNFGEFGSYSYTIPDDNSEWFNKALSVAAVFFPAYAPLITGAGTVAAGGDLKDVMKNVAGSYLTGELGQSLLTNEMVATGLGDLGIDITNLPDPVQNIIVDVSKGVLEGDSASDELQKSIASELWAAGKEYAPDLEDSIKNMLPDVDFDTPDWIEAIGDKTLTAIKPVIDVAEDIVKAPAEVAETLYKEVQPALKELDKKLIQPTLDVAQGATEAFIDPIDDAIDAIGKNVIDPALQTVKTAGESIINPIDDAIDTFGSEVVDPFLQAGSDVLSDFEDVVKEGGRQLDDLIDWDSLISSNLPSLPRPQTQTESLFENEIYQYKIKETPDMLFSNEQIKNYLKGKNTQQATNASVGFDMFGQPKNNASGLGLFGKAAKEFLSAQPVINNEPNKKDEEVKPFNLFS